MDFRSWYEEIAMAVTICDSKGIILYMNKKALTTFAKDGDLIGKSLFDCHPEPSRSLLISILKNQQPNTYTIEKNGIKKIILQKPWFSNGIFSGIVEMSSEIPFDMEHKIRKPQD